MRRAKGVPARTTSVGETDAILDPTVRPHRAEMCIDLPGSEPIRIRRPTDPRPFDVQPGDNYLLHIWPDGFEQAIDFVERNTVRRWSGVLRVEVLFIEGELIVERTWTRDCGNAKRGGSRMVKPRGKGWVYEDGFHDAHTDWRRERTWEVWA